MVLLPMVENQSYFCKPHDPAERHNAKQQRHQTGTFTSSKMGHSAVLYIQVGEMLGLLCSLLERKKTVLALLPTCE